MQLGRVGLWTFQLDLLPASAARETAAELEGLGYPTIWVPEAVNRDPIANCAMLLAATERLVLGTGIASIWSRDAMAMQASHLTLCEAHPDRFVLGLGVSHQPMVDFVKGQHYDRPLTKMSTYLDAMDAAPYMSPKPERTTRVLAALGPKMLELCGARTDGTILWMADEKAIESHVVPRLTAAASTAGRPSPRVVAGIPICLCADDEVDVAVARANRLLSEAEVSPNYQRLLDQGDAKQVGDLLAAGSESSIEKRIRSFADAGVTDISFRVVPIGDGRDELIASMKRTRQLIASLPGRV
jgi:probable F420-dependent oxidoreductase